uniref:Uncharacterized protein n=1 Tax=Cacopsylla melanoneura TaxID=428564 RepID=A0A8D9F3X6_9HEMI
MKMTQFTVYQLSPNLLTLLTLEMPQGDSVAKIKNKIACFTFTCKIRSTLFPMKDETIEFSLCLQIREGAAATLNLLFVCSLLNPGFEQDKPARPEPHIYMCDQSS